MKVESAFCRIVLWLGYSALAVWLWSKGSSMLDDRTLLYTSRMLGAVMLYVALSIAIIIAATISDSRKIVVRTIRVWWKTPIPSGYERPERLKRLFARQASYSKLVPVARRIRLDRRHEQYCQELLEAIAD